MVNFLDPKDLVYKDFSEDKTHSQHIGYPSLLPIAFGMLKYKSLEYNASIKMIQEHLDEGEGLTSISKHSHLYLENRGRNVYM